VGFLVHDPGAFHWRRLDEASRGVIAYDGEAEGSQGLSGRELREKRKLISGYQHDCKSPYDVFQGDDDPADAVDHDAPAFNPETPQTFKRGRKRYETDEEDFQKRAAWGVTRAKCEAILKAGKAWSPMDPKDDTRFLPDGTKCNLSNKRFKRIEYEIGVHWENFDSRKKLFAELGLQWETERKKELEDINMKKEMPTTKFTAAQIEDIKARDGRVAYVHAVTDKPRWYRLDMDQFETHQEAIEDIKRRGKDKVLKESKMWNNPRAPKAKFNQTLTRTRCTRYPHHTLFQSKQTISAVRQWAHRRHSETTRRFTPCSLHAARK
jgi:hypothetical protein